MKMLVAVAMFGFMAMSTAQAAQVLELRNTNGMGSLTKDVIVDSNGTVTETHLISPPSTESPPQVVATLSGAEISSIETSIASIQQAPLERTDPNQYYNPGGFESDYVLTLPNGEAFTFAKNVSGVDFGLPNSQGQDLVAILKKLAQ